MSEYCAKQTLLLLYCATVALNNKLYTMHGTYIKISQKNISWSTELCSWPNVQIWTAFTSDWPGKGQKTNFCNDGYEQ